MDSTEAYENIRAEKEAYSYETDNTYIYKRKPFGWLYS